MANSKGFTLIELLVVILIIGLLSSMAMFAVNMAREKAKVAVVQHDIDVIASAIRSLANDSLLWPGPQPVDTICTLGCGANEICATCATGLASSSAGITATDGSYPNWDGPYMNAIPLDPWGHQYFFDTDYSLDINEEPCACGGGACHNVAAIGSYGSSDPSDNAYNCEEIVKVMAW